MATYLKTFVGILFFVFVFGCSESIDSTGQDGNQTADTAPTLNAGGVYTMTVDATSREEWVRLHLTDGIVGSDDEWDLAFRRFAIRLNGGGSGSGTAIGQFVPGADFAGASQAPDTGWVTDGAGAAELVFATWYDYNGQTHILTPVEGHWIVRGGSGQSFYAFQILSYYNEAGDSAVYSLQWREVDAPATLPELTAGSGTLPEDTDNPQSSGGGQGTSAEMSGADSGAGCYSGPPNHMCDCELTEDECATNAGIWTDQCECGGDDSTDDADDDQTVEAGAGCYSGPPSHMCDCALTEDECASNEGIWTDRCECGADESDEETNEDADDDEAEDVMVSTDAYGCYSGPPNHMCDCELTEDECADNAGVWTERCACDEQ